MILHSFLSMTEEAFIEPHVSESILISSISVHSLSSFHEGKKRRKKAPTALLLWIWKFLQKYHKYHRGRSMKKRVANDYSCCHLWSRAEPGVCERRCGRLDIASRGTSQGSGKRQANTHRPTQWGITPAMNMKCLATEHALGSKDLHLISSLFIYLFPRLFIYSQCNEISRYLR